MSRILDERILILTPNAQEAEDIFDSFSRSSLSARSCKTIEELSDEICFGVGVVVLAEEVCDDNDFQPFVKHVIDQPGWSSIPVVILIENGDRSPTTIFENPMFEAIPNVTLIERPVTGQTLLSVVRSLLRARCTQYEIRRSLSERDQQTAELEMSRELLQRTIESVKDCAVFTTDVDGVITSWNSGAENLFGWKEPEILGHSADVLFTLDDRRAQIPAHELLYATRTGRSQDDRWHLRKDGSQFFASGVVTPQRHGLTVDGQNGDYSTHGYTMVVRDITEVRKAQEELRNADRKKDEFLATLAHELRNPLAPIRTGLQIIKLSPAGSPNAERAREVMERQLNHMVRLVDDLLDVSRISRGKLQLKVERISLDNVLKAALETSAPLIEQSAHELKVFGPSDGICVEADLTRLAQVISNLLNNAAKYTPRGGTISLRTSIEDRDAVITISDTGVGIPTEKLNEVFDMFTQVGRPTGATQGGLGIGLSLVKRLIELHRGSISAYSAGAGRGSAFTLRLPLAQSDKYSNQISESPIDGEAISQHEEKRILVVDDNVDGAECLAMMLQMSGYTVQTAFEGFAAIDAAKAFRPHLIFLDIGLPGLNGYEVASHLRSLKEFSDTVVIALTGWGSDEDKRKSAVAGFNFHITKPIEAQAVESIISQFLKNEELAPRTLHS